MEVLRTIQALFLLLVIISQLYLDYASGSRSVLQPSRPLRPVSLMYLVRLFPHFQLPFTDSIQGEGKRSPLHPGKGGLFERAATRFPRDADRLSMDEEVMERGDDSAMHQ